MKLAILAAIGAAATVLAPTEAEAQVQRQLQFFNSCPVPVRYFIAIPRNGAWQTFGWFNATGSKPVHDLLDQYRNPIFIPEGTRVHYYAETTGQPSVRWYGTVNINMNGASYPAKVAGLSVRGGKFQFGLNCDKEMNGGYAAPRQAPAPNYGGGNRGGGAGWTVGKRVSCDFKRSGMYFPGRIGQIRTGDSIYIEYDDGDREWTTTSACRPG
ncbi:MAG: hypothetical protein EOP62_12185 [Sphingomonadales bacterium]|nr:MAG: hypothetical protein EOP62_12185 [Sphingomonadales bacterium]